MRIETEYMTVIRGAPRHVVSASRLVAGAPSHSEGQQQSPPRVWYSPEIDASQFTLHILSDTPGGFQWLKYILLMLCNTSRRLGDGKHVILRQRVRGSVRAIRAVGNTCVFLTETRVVGNGSVFFTNKDNIYQILHSNALRSPCNTVRQVLLCSTLSYTTS